MKNLFNHNQTDHEKALETNARIRELELTIIEQDKLINTLKNDVERLNRTHSEQLTEATNADRETFAKSLAPSISQLETLRLLSEIKQKSVPSENIFKVVSRLINSLKTYGIIIDQEVGSIEEFNPARHNPISQSEHYPENTPVEIKFCGISFDGKNIHKAIVEKKS
jgi:molecular chaperone GrpE (heat shock protein)